VRIDADSIAGAHHGLVADAIGDAQTRRGLNTADGYSAVVGLIAHAAQANLASLRVVDICTVVIARRQRIAFETDPVIDRQLSANLPLVAGIESVVAFAHGRRVDVLGGNAHGLRCAEQKVRPGVVEVRGRASAERSYAARESETSARSE